MTKEEIDILWQQAMQESIKDGEMYTRYRFAKFVEDKVLAEHAMQEVQRLGQEIEQEPLEYWNAVEGWVKIDEVRKHFDSVGCGTIYKSAGEGRVPLCLAQPEQEPVACKTLCELCVKRGYTFCANAVKTTPIHPPPQPERHELQAKGEHPAPCARHCEANAFQIVIKNLESKLAQPEQEPFGFAGVKMWVGNQQVVKLLTQTELHYATQPWLDMLMIAEKCLVELKQKNGYAEEKNT